MGCAGCKKNMSDPQGTFKMRFIGKPDGKLMKGARAGYEHGKVYLVPFKYSRFPFWELVEPVPELKVPEATKIESVYEETAYVPDDEPEDAVSFEDAGSNTWKEHMEEVMRRDAAQGLYHIDVDEELKPIVPEPEPEEKSPLSRDELRAILDSAGVEYSPRARTETLAKLAEGLKKPPE